MLLRSRSHVLAGSASETAASARSLGGDRTPGDCCSVARARIALPGIVHVGHQATRTCSRWKPPFRISTCRPRSAPDSVPAMSPWPSSRPLKPRFCSSSRSSCGRSTFVRRHLEVAGRSVPSSAMCRQRPALVAARRAARSSASSRRSPYCTAASLPGRSSTRSPRCESPAAAGESPGDRDGRSPARSHRARASAPRCVVANSSRLLRVGRRRRQLVELEPSDLDEGRVGRRVHCASDERPARAPSTLYVLLQIQRLVVPVRQVAAVEGAARSASRGALPADGAVDERREPSSPPARRASRAP